MQEQKANHTVLAHVRANIWLLMLSLVICCILYPAAVWAVGQVLFHHAAQGSLIDAKGDSTSDPTKAVGSMLIAQQFNSAVFFQPRPSAASYNAAASGGSNLAASSPKLRGRVAQLLGTIARYSEAYKKAHPKSDGTEPSVQEDIVAWFKEQTAPTIPGTDKRDLFTEWANNYATMSQGWATGTPSIQDSIQNWEDKHPEATESWKTDNPKATQPPAFNDLLPYFFKGYEKEHPNTWPTFAADAAVEGQISDWAKGHDAVMSRWKAAHASATAAPKDDELTTFFFTDYAQNPKDWPMNSGAWLDALVKPTAPQDSDVQSTFFDMWLTEQAQARKLDPLKDFVQVPADLVTTSGSGLDPDITLRNAQYQSDSVVTANRDAIIAAYENDEANKKAGKKATDAQKSNVEADVRKVVKELLTHASRPMFGLTGDEPLLNVLQLNLALKAKMDALKVE